MTLATSILMDMSGALAAVRNSLTVKIVYVCLCILSHSGLLLLSFQSVSRSVLSGRVDSYPGVDVVSHNEVHVSRYEVQHSTPGYPLLILSS